MTTKFIGIAISAIIGYLVYLKVNKDDEVLLTLPADQIISYKKDWIFNYWLSYKKHNIIGFSLMLLGGMALFPIIISRMNETLRLILMVICAALFIGGLIYLIVYSITRKKKFELYIDELYRRKVKPSDLKAEFEEWKSSRK